MIWHPPCRTLRGRGGGCRLRLRSGPPAPARPGGEEFYRLIAVGASLTVAVGPFQRTQRCRSQGGNEISALSVQAEVVYGGPGQNFTSGVAGFVGSGEGGTQQEAA
jgi:hypothetical protein